MNDQIYKKTGRRYVPIGPNDGFTGFPVDGIWLVQMKDECHSSECILRLGELQDMQPAVNLILGYKDKISKYLLTAQDEGKISIRGTNISDFVLKLLKEITKT